MKSRLDELRWLSGRRMGGMDGLRHQPLRVAHPKSQLTKAIRFGSSGNDDDSGSDSADSNTALLPSQASTAATETESPILRYNKTDSDHHDNNFESYFAMQQFFQNVANLKAAFREISANADHIYRLKHRLIYTITPEMEAELSGELNKSIDQTNGLISDTKRLLDVLGVDNSSQSDVHSETSEWRIRQNIRSSLVKTFSECVQEFRLIQAEYKQQIRRKLTKQFLLVHPDMTESDVDKMVATGDVFAGSSSLMQEESNSANVLSDLESKALDIMKLEKGVQELHQIYVELAQNLNNQSKSLDHIEINVNEANQYAAKSKDELLLAAENTTIWRKQTLCVTTTLMVLTAFFLFPTLLRLIST